MSGPQPTTTKGGIVLDILLKGRGIERWVMSAQARRDILAIEDEARTQGAAAERERLRAIDPEWLASVFHYEYERLAPAHGYETRQASAVPWGAVPDPNRSLMIDVAAAVLLALLADPEPDE